MYTSKKTWLFIPNDLHLALEMAASLFRFRWVCVEMIDSWAVAASYSLPLLIIQLLFHWKSKPNTAIKQNHFKIEIEDRIVSINSQSLRMHESRIINYQFFSLDQTSNSSITKCSKNFEAVKFLIIKKYRNYWIRINERD